ncbi:MFS transporter [Streptomyces collinus]|uniref:MFS family arabinose efflux permease n=2 Tax=Streptomyces TaxID=1883 RepID=A0AA89Q0K9_STRCU|nr:MULTISPECIES: MFS transporter [Streptomyces]MBB5812272.1 putative MFS family arabinose efflux permease [Streptomyces collinus]MEC7055107.1 MFS transporter [Streptomyces violaceochromogenes]WMX65436.1 MFS transporter [Streptomyces collinus]GHC71407.1 putative transporter [Streptomyces violaceochromogenes]
MPSATTTAARGTAAPVRQARTPAPGLFLTLLAVCSAVTAANIYLAAPLLPLMARDFGSAPSAIAWIASVAQLGYAVGLLFFAPLGDRANRRRLVAGLTLVTALALGASAAAPGTAALAAAMFVASAATVIPQLLVPLVAERAPAERRARHVAAVIAGLFTGIVAARVLGGLAGQAFGWRWVFAGAAVLTLALGLATAVVLPSRGRREGPLFAGLVALPSVLRGSPELWRACVRQAGMFGAWSALWTSLALLLTGPEHGLSTATAGLFGLFGLTASAVAPLAGGLVDRFGAARVVRSAYLVAAVSVPLFWLGGQVLWALFAAAVAVHAALVASHVANQTLALTATSTPATANTAYVVAGFAGGAAASALAGTAYTHFGWGGVCVVAGVWLVLGWGLTSVRR